MTAGSSNTLSPGKGLVFMLIFTVFWCGITGVLAYVFVVGPLLRHHYAKAHFAATEGVVIESRMTSHSGSGEGSDTYSATIKYRYTVGDAQYTGDRYDFLGGSSSDDSYAQRLVRENPAGKEITVYYDPEKPAEAVLHLELPGMCYMLILFLQPFALAGLGLTYACVTLPVSQRRRRFLENEAASPWTIPGWGVMKEDMHGLTISSKPHLLSVLVYLLGGYGAACFASIFVLAAFFHGFGDASPGVVRSAFVASAAVGVLTMAWRFLRQSASAVTIDRLRGRLAIHSRKRDGEVRLADVTGLRLREIPYPRGISVNNERIRYMLLEAVRTNGGTVPIHAFRRAGQPDSTAIAEKTRDALAALVGVISDKTVLASEIAANDTGPNSFMDAIGQIGQAIAAPGRESYSDLA